jgi:hypothetical protein
MRSSRLRFLPWLIGAFLLLLIAGYFHIAGSAIVIDETGGVESAVVKGGGGTEQKIYRLWDGYFYAIPRVEGTIEVRCTNGVRKRWGYVTANFDTTVKVVGKSPCERLIHARAASGANGS